MGVGRHAGIEPRSAVRAALRAQRNVLDQLPDRMRERERGDDPVVPEPRQAAALRLLNNLERRLAKDHPGAAAT